jgi:hypothetical protein
MKLETASSRFLEKLHAAERVVSMQDRFPNRLLRDHLSVAGFFDSDAVFAEDFLSMMKSFLSRRGEDGFSLLVLDPDPEEYFYANFKRFPLLEIPISATEAEFFEALDEDPGESPADAIRYNSNRIVIFSVSLDWTIYVDRNFEVGILGASSKAVADDLKTVFDSRILSRNEVVTDILPLVFAGSNAADLQDVIETFNEQYKLESA